MSSNPPALRTQLPLANTNTVIDVLQSRASLGQKSLSFEFFPPKDGSEDQLWETFDSVLNVDADFVSVTYGAGGTNQDKSFAVLERMASNILTVGHLTCVGASAESTRNTIERFENLGVRSILALRGDSPKHDPDALQKGDLKTALELVDIVHQVSGLEVGVAAFPEVHPESKHAQQDAAVLKLKQDAGASYGITQLFFAAEYYTNMVQAAAAAGSNLPIIPGLMPVSNAKQLLRMAGMSGAAVPADLAHQLETADEATA
jgi:methylenetetrahydrofolate reductase (NADPH)